MSGFVRLFTCPAHGEVSESPRQRDWHCCTAVGHRCGWSGDPDDHDGCGKPLAVAVWAEQEASQEPAPHGVAAAARTLLSTAVAAEALLPLGDGIDEAIEHVLSGESAACAECGATGGSCAIARLQSTALSMRLAGLLPWNANAPRCLVTLRVADANLIEMFTSLSERFPAGEWRRVGAAWEFWSGPVTLPLSGSDDAIQEAAVG